MPGPSKQSRFMQRCVADVTGQGKALGSAFAICTAQSQKAGYSEPGSRKQTGKGKAREKQFKKESDMGTKAKAYERAVQRGLLSRTKAGAVGITTAGKNVAEGQEDGMRDLLRRLEDAYGSLDEGVRVDTTTYEFDHGKKPRGFGSWAFSFDEKDVSSDEMLWVNQSTYGDALKKAKAEAKKRGAMVIYPQP